MAKLWIRFIHKARNINFVIELEPRGNGVHWKDPSGTLFIPDGVIWFKKINGKDCLTLHNNSGGRPGSMLIAALELPAHVDGFDSIAHRDGGDVVSIKLHSAKKLPTARRTWRAETAQQ